MDERISRLLYPAERLHDVVDCLEIPSFDVRATLGSSWPWLHRVVLLVTDRRLLELAVRPMGRGLQGRVRTFPWSRVAAVSTDEDHLRLTSRDGAVVEWQPVSAVDGSLLLRLKAGAGLLGEGFGARICDRCGSAAFSRHCICSGCNARVVDPGEMADRGWAIPGAGLMMTRHHLLGAGRLVLELGVALAIGAAVLLADDALTLGAVVVGAAVVLILIKIESARITRAAAARSGVGMKWSGRLWDRLRLPAVLVLAALLVVPLFFAGAFSSRVSSDLDFVGPEGLWTRSLQAAANDDPHTRSVWSHRDGWSVTVSAAALDRFATFREVRRAIERSPGVEARPVEDSSFDAILVIDPKPGPDDADRPTKLAVYVFDHWGRDVHTISATAPADAVDRRAAAVHDLLRHAVWVDAYPAAGAS